MVELEHSAEVIAEGKTKIVRGIPGNPGNVIIQSKDQIFGRGAERPTRVPGKGEIATHIATNCFTLLHEAGIPNHFVRRETPDSFVAEKLTMIPIELVARRIGYGSFINRHPDIAPGTRFDDLTFEYFAKDGRIPKSIAVFDFANGIVHRHSQSEPISAQSLVDAEPIAGSPFGITPEQAETLQQLTLTTFGLLEAAWADEDVTLVDLKIECGFAADGSIKIGDIIDNEVWRIWQQGDMLDKEIYRAGGSLERVMLANQRVAVATDRFIDRSE